MSPILKCSNELGSSLPLQEVVKGIEEVASEELNLSLNADEEDVKLVKIFQRCT